MALFHSPSIVRNGLVMYLDGANTKSYNYSENLFTYSTDYNSGYWVYTASSSTATVATLAPDGSFTAVKLIGGSGQTGRKSIYQGIAVTSGSQYTFSVYMKAAEFTSTTMWFDSANISPSAYYGAGALINLTSGGIGGSSPTQVTVIPAGNGWYRCSVTAAPTVSGTMNFQVSQGDANGSGTPAGDGTSGVYLWGPQLQRSPYISNYSPTQLTTITPTTAWNDMSGQGNNAVLSGIPFTTATTGAFMLNGTNQFATVSNNFVTTATYTKCIWLNYTALGSNNMLSNSPGTIFWLNGGNRITAADTSVGYGTAASNTALSQNTWYHAAVTYNSIGVTTSTWKIYVNGVLDSTTYAGASPPLAGIQIGAFGSGNLFQGRLALPMIYNRVLSDAEIQKNFQAQRDRFGI